MLIASPEAHGVTVRRNSDLGLVPSLSLRQLWDQREQLLPGRIGINPAVGALKELREQNGRLKRLLAEAELEKDALREVAKGKF
jgi:hypothetical protein